MAILPLATFAGSELRIESDFIFQWLYFCWARVVGIIALSATCLFLHARNFFFSATFLTTIAPALSFAFKYIEVGLGVCVFTIQDYCTGFFLVILFALTSEFFT